MVALSVLEDLGGEEEASSEEDEFRDEKTDESSMDMYYL